MIPAYSVRRQWREIPATGERKPTTCRATGKKIMERLVQKRQVGLASITTLAKNNEYKRWFEDGEIEFKLAS